MTLLSSIGALPSNLHVNYYFEVCSLVFLVAITIAYYARKKNEISNKNDFIQKLLGEMLAERYDTLEAFNALKETGIYPSAKC